MIATFELLAEPNRRRILDLLLDGDRAVGELVDRLGMSQPSVSKHLRVLREPGLVDVRTDAQRRVYRLRTEPLEEVDAWLEPYRKRWNDRFDRLEQHLATLQPPKTKETPMTTTTTPAGVISASSDATGIHIVRIFDAPIEAVFAAWTQPEHFSTWFGEHDSSMTVDDVTMDLRPGGAWRAVMHVTEPQVMDLVFHGEFREIDPPHRLVMTIDDMSGDIPSGVDEFFTVDLVDLGGRTEMTFSQTGGNLPSDEYSRAMRGELIFFDRLAAHVEGPTG